MRWISGSSMPRGRLARTRVIASLMSLSARSVFGFEPELMVVLDMPSLIDE